MISVREKPKTLSLVTGFLTIFNLKRGIERKMHWIGDNL